MAPIPAGQPGQRTDDELIAAHVAGDPGAFAELFHRHHRQLALLAARRTRSPEDADDVLQEAMLAAHNSAGRFRRQATVSTWLHRIVVNKCVDQLRRPDNRLTPVAEIDGTGTRDIDSDVLTAVLVHRALTALAPDQRAAVVAVDMHGYSVAEAAELLGVAQGTVKSRRARARARLAVLLADFDPVRPDAA